MPQIDPYNKCPVYETEKFILRLVNEGDVVDLLECYSNPQAQQFFNSDNCCFGFEYHTLESMENCIQSWIEAYKSRGFIRFSIVNKKLSKVIGTIEMFARFGDDSEYNPVGVLRIDLFPDYETQSDISQLLQISNEHFFDDFDVDHIITKAIPEATERVQTLMLNGFTRLEDFRIMAYPDYYIQHRG